MTAVFSSLDFVYTPTPDVDTAVDHYVHALGAELVWKVRALGTTVAAVRLSDVGPLVLLAGHLHDEKPVLAYRVEDYVHTTWHCKPPASSSTNSRSLTAPAPHSVPREANVSPSTSSPAPKPPPTSTDASIPEPAPLAASVERRSHSSPATVAPMAVSSPGTPNAAADATGCPSEMGDNPGPTRPGTPNTRVILGASAGWQTVAGSVTG